MYGNHMHGMKDPQYSLKIMANDNSFSITFSIFIFYDNPSQKLLNDLSKWAGDFGEAARKVAVAIFSSEELENNCTVLGRNTTTDRQIHVLHCHHRRKTFYLVSNSFVIISADVL